MLKLFLFRGLSFSLIVLLLLGVVVGAVVTLAMVVDQEYLLIVPAAVLTGFSGAGLVTFLTWVIEKDWDLPT